MNLSPTTQERGEDCFGVRSAHQNHPRKMQLQGLSWRGGATADWIQVSQRDFREGKSAWVKVRGSGTELKLGGQNGHRQAETETWNSRFIQLWTLIFFVHAGSGVHVVQPSRCLGRAQEVELGEKKLGVTAPIHRWVD